MLPGPNSMRFQVETANSMFCNVPSQKLTLGANSLLFSDLTTDCFSDPNAPELHQSAETASSSLVRISWRVMTNASARRAIRLLRLEYSGAAQVAVRSPREIGHDHGHVHVGSESA